MLYISDQKNVKITASQSHVKLHQRQYIFFLFLRTICGWNVQEKYMYYTHFTAVLCSFILMYLDNKGKQKQNKHYW